MNTLQSAVLRGVRSVRLVLALWLAFALLAIVAYRLFTLPGTLWYHHAGVTADFGV